MATALPRFKPGTNVPAFANTAVLAGRFVKVTGDRTTEGAYSIGQCSVAGEHALGVAEADSAPATDAADSVERHINIVRGRCIARVKPGAAIARNTPVKTDASGQAIDQAAAGTILGYTMYAVAGTEALVDIDLL